MAAFRDPYAPKQGINREFKMRDGRSNFVFSILQGFDRSAIHIVPIFNYLLDIFFQRTSGRRTPGWA